jgi:RNA polymerase sigma factor (sigma-70 family)
MPTPTAQELQAATSGDLAALDSLLRRLQPAVFNLALRMLGQRDDAADATQEILLKIVTHLGSFRAEAAFPTWVFQVARNHLLTALTKAREAPLLSLDAMADKLQQGLDFAAQHGAVSGEHVLTPEEKLAARQVALSCTQGMLMALDREDRLAYLLDLLFGLSGKDAAEVMACTPQAYRQRLSRARSKLEGFASTTCGRINNDAACRCERQLPALQHLQQQGQRLPPGLASSKAEQQQAERTLDALVRMGDAAALFRAHPEYQAPAALLGAITTVLRAEGFAGLPPTAPGAPAKGLQ